MFVIRYFRLFAYFVQFSISKALQFRLDFFFRIVMDLLYYAINIAFYRVIYLTTPILGGWSEPQVMVFVGGYLFVDALNMTLFSNNTWWIPQMINRGDLDYYLLRPVSSLFFVSLRDFAVNSFVNLVFASAILAWALSRLPVPLSVGKAALYLMLLLNGTFIYYLLNMLFTLPTFWTHSANGFQGLFMTTNKLMERPDRIFRGLARWMVTLILPFSLIASFPARLALEVYSWRTLGHIAVVTLILFWVVTRLWEKGLSTYSSASS